MEIKYLREDKNFFNDIDNIEEKEKIIKNKLKKHLEANNLCFLLGSGCSVGAIPLMGNTFEKLKKEEPLFNDKNREKIIGEYEDNNNIEAYLNWLLKIIEVLPKHSADFIKVFEKTKQVLAESIKIDCFSEKNVLNNYKNLYKNIFEQRLISNIDTPVNIFTTNYDLFNECALECLNIHYFNGFVGNINRKFSPDSFNIRIVDEKNRYKDKWSPIKKLARLYKIHGSIDWIDTEHGIMQTQEKDKSIDKVMIYPTVSKHTQTQQTPYSELFREFNIKLQEKNTTLIIIGYGFSDTHVNTLISQALTKDDFILIVFSDIKNNAEIFYNKHKTQKNVHFITGSEEGKFAHHFSYIVENLISNDDIIGDEQL